jgi:hypothetical protein
MKRFVIKTIYISLPILGVAILMELLLRNTPNDYLFKKQYLDKHSSEIETLILGSSHSFYGFNPEYFSSNTFNASHISQSLNYDFEILKKYQDQFKNLKTIILPISYFTLFGKLEAGSESWRVKNYIIYYDLNSSKSLIDYSEVLSNRINVNIKRIALYYVLGNSTISCTDLGWGTNHNSKNAIDLAETGKTASKRHTMEDINSDKYQQIFQENIFILESIIQWSNKNNVKVLLLTPPAFETYRQNLNQEQLKITINTTSEICSRYENCIYENLLSDINFVALDFFDADHLSEIGAKKLSELINEKISE